MDTEYRRAANITVIVAGILMFFWLFFKYALSIAMPFLLAALIAVIISPLAASISKKTHASPKFVSALLVILFFGVIATLLSLAISRLVSEVGNLKLPPEKNFDITADFSTTTPEIEAEIAFSLRVWHFADVGVRGVFGGISKFFKRSDNIEDTLSDALSKSLSHISTNKENN